MYKTARAQRVLAPTIRSAAPVSSTTRDAAASLPASAQKSETHTHAMPPLLPPDTIFSRSEVFSRERGSLVLEAGCGNGHFLAEYARMFPLSDCIGIDIRERRIVRACRKAEIIANLRFFRGDAFALLRGYFSNTEFTNIFVNFPDPWPKYRHRDKRLNTEGHLAELLARIAPGGALVWVSDYYPQIIDVLLLMQPFVRRGEFQNTFGRHGYGEGLADYPMTLYERRWRAMGRRIYYLRFEKSVRI